MTLSCLRTTRPLLLYKFIVECNSLVHGSLVRISNWTHLPTSFPSFLSYSSSTQRFSTIPFLCNLSVVFSSPECGMVFPETLRLLCNMAKFPLMRGPGTGDSIQSLIVKTHQAWIDGCRGKEHLLWLMNMLSELMAGRAQRFIRWAMFDQVANEGLCKLES
jgi:hypothetical protein